MISMKQSLLTGVALAAIVAGTGGAFAQTVVKQGSANAAITNNADVTNSQTNSTVPGAPNTQSSISFTGNAAVGSSAAVSASGAVAGASVSAVSTGFNGPDLGFDAVTQYSLNTGAITNTSAGISGHATAGTLAAGSSASVSATGAAASLGVSAINVGSSTNTVAVPVVGNAGANIQQVTNQGAVANDKATLSLPAYTVSGDGASLSASATGAAASFGFSSIDSYLTDTGTSIGSLTQTVTNGTAGTTPAPANISNTGAKVTVGDMSGNGSSASIGGTGAVASLSFANIGAGAEGNFTVSDILQSVNNTGSIGNGGSISAGALSGTGSSASISASGAVASVSQGSISATGTLGTPTIASIVQNATNSAASPISNVGTITLTGGLGTGASAQIASTGAGAFASFRAVK